jgi:hypothetical protein
MPDWLLGFTLYMASIFAALGIHLAIGLHRGTINNKDTDGYGIVLVTSLIWPFYWVTTLFFVLTRLVLKILRIKPGSVGAPEEDAPQDTSTQEASHG